MPEHHSRAGKRVERVAVTDEPHDRYRGHDPWTGERLDHGIPILTNTPSGNVVDKNVTRTIVHCPECDIEARYSDDSEPVCPNCGIICSGGDARLNELIVRDAKAAGRIDGDADRATS